MPFTKALLSLSVIFLLSSCNLFGGQKYQTVSVADFAKKINEGNVQLVDVRTPEEYAEKHLKDAVNINFNDDGFIDKMEKLDKTKPVLIYCLSGGRSSKASALISSKGYDKVVNLDGGILAWTNAGNPVEAPAGTTGNTGLDMNAYLAKVKSDKLVLVDFSAVWCGPCKLLKPIVEKLAGDHKDKMEVLPIDVDKNPAVSNAMHITGIPLLILYKNGKEVWRQMGLTDRETIEQQIKLNSK
ncbi:MAG: thioredoxin family protein [Bacteroidetes bacterium]|nr:thioredoxin family protein [Bacteroidota bacterium]